MRVLVVYASADGSTAEIARRIAQRLRERGHEVSDQSAGAAGSLDAIKLRLDDPRNPMSGLP